MTWQLVLFLHTLAATIWIGGQITVFLVAPLVRRHAGEREREVLGAVGRAYGGVSGLALLALLLTGLLQADHMGWRAGHPFTGTFSRLVTEKLILVLGMIAISAVHAVVGMRVARGTIGEGARAGARWLSVVNLLLGLAALWIAADIVT